MDVAHCEKFFSELILPTRQQAIAAPVIREVLSRLSFMNRVGLNYLTLDRATSTLSGGEAQRIRLATQTGSALCGVCYVLDEPSIGLHQRDNERLLDTLKTLVARGNSVILVEHRAADHIVDMGPGAGPLGGTIIAQGSLEQIMAHSGSLTGAYLSGRKRVPFKGERRKPGSQRLELKGVRTHNLKNVTVEIPLGLFVAVTGVSGSGKSSLIMDTLLPALQQTLHGATSPVTWQCEAIKGASLIDKIIDVDQSPIGRTPRSNPATFTGVFADIRELFAELSESRVRGYKSGRYSFNVKGGRCEACSGDGLIRVEMSFLPDTFIECEVCGGKRYNRETLEVRYKGSNIDDVLNMTCDQACDFMENHPKIQQKLKTLHQVGLGYLKLGQNAATLSGGEAQRLKLAKELARKSTGRTLYILDEPTTGLHFSDVHTLLEVLGELVDQGNTVLVIEHNLDVIKSADHVIDLGPDGGENGGRIVAQGTPKEVARSGSATGEVLKKTLG